MSQEWCLQKEDNPNISAKATACLPKEVNPSLMLQWQVVSQSCSVHADFLGSFSILPLSTSRRAVAVGESSGAW